MHINFQFAIGIALVFFTALLCFAYRSFSIEFKKDFLIFSYHRLSDLCLFFKDILEISFVYPSDASTAALGPWFLRIGRAGSILEKLFLAAVDCERALPWCKSWWPLGDILWESGHLVILSRKCSYESSLDRNEAIISFSRLGCLGFILFSNT